MEALNALLNGEEPGYAKLQGEHFDYFMQAHSIILGRSSKKENVDLDISVLGGGMEISRRHARIFYDFQLRRFTLEVLGKHGCIVQGVLYLPGGGPVKLNSQDLLQIGQTKFYFLLPTRSIEATLVAQRTLIPSQPLSSSFMRSTHPHSSDVREHSYGNDYGRDNGDNGVRVGTEALGKFMKQSKRSGDLDIYSRYPINVEPVGALGEREKGGEIVNKEDGCYMGEEQLERRDGCYIISRIGNNKSINYRLEGRTRIQTINSSF